MMDVHKQVTDKTIPYLHEYKPHIMFNETTKSKIKPHL
jgi:hypothetical protein